MIAQVLHDQSAGTVHYVETIPSPISFLQSRNILAFPCILYIESTVEHDVI